MKALLCVVVFLILLLILNQIIPKKSSEKWIVISPMWGLCNRLRTLRVAHDLAKKLGRKLAVIDNMEDSEFKSMFNGRLQDLFTSPYLSFWSRAPWRGVHKLQFNHDCSLHTTLHDVSRIQAPYIVIRACGLKVEGLTETNDFYKSIKPSDRVMQRIGPILHRLFSVVGVHIRQGNISDYRKGIFFGPWKKHEDPTLLPIECCSTQSDKNAVCPANAPPIELFISEMKRLQQSQSQLYFICSDRPGCYQRLQQEFPGGRILSNPVEIEYDANAFNAFCDWYCLSQCKQIITTSISSFSEEAAKMNGASVISISTASK